ncbi:DoxX family protein [Candidatus Nomurabacteria bacterium]|nr:DoxX family protein [Candidatus Nomurabacteria bacterium]
MLNVFPELLSYSLLAPFVLRLFLGGFFLYAGWQKIVGKRADWEKLLADINLVPTSLWLKIFAVIEIVCGGFMVIGFLTQIVTVILAFFMILALSLKRKEFVLKESYFFYILVLVISISLLFSGAGAWAIDLPL